VDKLRLISVDDHVIEPGHVWQRYLPEKYRADGPKLVRERGAFIAGGGSGGGKFGQSNFVESADGGWADVWHFGGHKFVIPPAMVAAAKQDTITVEGHERPIILDDVQAGCYEQSARLDDMDANDTEASLCFPTFPRFCGQTFLMNAECDVRLACVRAYNDWMIEEWCGGEGYGRLIPLTLIPLWDAELAAAEVRRCADKGAHAVSFSEGPDLLGLPTIHRGYWDPLFAACEETETVVNMHIGSSSRLAEVGPDAPRAVRQALGNEGATHAFCHWLASGTLQRFPSLRVSFTEGQVGWMPYLLERLDSLWKHPGYVGLADRLSQAPSTAMPQIYGCIYDDLVGLRLRDSIGMKNIMFEIDYPHGDSTWPNSKKVFDELVEAAGLDENEAIALARGNAIECFGLSRFGITA
jgi:predicted TIM-barrel fold metal-dependent hydrolase